MSRQERDWMSKFSLIVSRLVVMIFEWSRDFEINK